MSLTIDDGGLFVKDPADELVILVNWDDHLAAGATITSSDFTITSKRPSGDTALTKDNETIPALSRSTQLRLLAGTLGGLYEVANLIVTNESPAQTKERSFFVLVQNR